MDDERRASIEAALRRYRETVTQHNLSLLRTLVEAIEALPPPPNCSEAVAQFHRMRRIDYFLGVSVSQWVKSPRDLLNDDVRDKVISIMDGVCDREVNLRGREEYFAAVGARIAELNVAVTVAEFPPADLAYLCTLIDGITGPGLHYYHVSQQIEFLSPFQEGAFNNSVGVPVRYDEDGDDESWKKYDELTWIWTDWEVAVAFQFGEAPFTGGSFTLYCRNEEHKQWKWRYGVHDEDWCSDAYDSVEDFLDYYAHFREQTEEDIRKDVKQGGLPR